MTGTPLPTHEGSWIVELERTAAEPTLPAAARLALITTIDAFAEEDGYLGQPAEYARTLLAAGLTDESAGPDLRLCVHEGLPGGPVLGRVTS